MNGHGKNSFSVMFFVNSNKIFREVFGNARTSVEEALEGIGSTESFPDGCLGKTIFEQAGQMI